MSGRQRFMLQTGLRFPAGILRRTEASSIVEFAVSLPLLVVLVVGIFDFGGAFNTKQELNNAVREGARFGASQPTNDLSVPPPTPSVEQIRSLVDAYLLASRINDCGLGSAIATLPNPLIWTYTASTGCAGTLTLTINRGNPTGPYSNVLETVAGVTSNVVYTQVIIIYPYQWHFNNVLQLLVPGATLGLSNITTDALATNMN